MLVYLVRKVSSHCKDVRNDGVVFPSGSHELILLAHHVAKIIQYSNKGPSMKGMNVNELRTKHFKTPPRHVHYTRTVSYHNLI